MPGQRSAHEMPIPFGGGIAIVITFVLSVGVLVTLGKIPVDFLALLVGPIALAILGLVDDIKSLSASFRIPFHFGAAIWSVLFVGAFPDINLNGFILELNWVGYIVGVLYLVWLLNLFNFMDGIDGLAASEAICVTAGICFFILFRETQYAIWVMLAIAGSCVGFLMINWPPAKLFMGDVGSGFLGIVLGVMSLMTVNEGVVSIWSWLILLGFFIVDASLTLIIRLLRGEKVHEAHDLHAYQHANRVFGGKIVLFSVLAINIFWLLPLAWLADEKENLGFLLFVLAYVPVAVLCWGCGSGQLNARLWKMSTD